MLKKKIWANFQRIIELFTPKIVNKRVRDPGSEILDPEKTLFRIPNPGVKKAPDPGPATLGRWAAFLPLVRYHNFVAADDSFEVQKQKIFM